MPIGNEAVVHSTAFILCSCLFCTAVIQSNSIIIKILFLARAIYSLILYSLHKFSIKMLFSKRVTLRMLETPLIGFVRVLFMITFSLYFSFHLFARTFDDENCSAQIY